MFNKLFVSRALHDKAMFNLGVENFSQLAEIKNLNLRISNQCGTIEDLTEYVRLLSSERDSLSKKLEDAYADIKEISGMNKLVLEIPDKAVCKLTMHSLILGHATPAKYTELKNKIHDVDKLAIKYKGMCLIINRRDITDIAFFKDYVIIMWN